MAPRPFWKGYLKLSLVTCPVAMGPATSESEKIRFRTVNRETGNRVESRYVDSVTGKPVADDDQVKGYPTGEDSYVALEDEELEAVALESTRTIDIERFVPADSVSWVWYDKPHYLVPDDKVGEEAYAVIREAMKATGTVALSRLVLYRRERAVMIEPRDRGMVLWTLRYGDEVRDATDYFDEIRDDKPDAKLTSMIGKLIEARMRGWDSSLAQDPVQKKLRSVIAAKQRKAGPKKAPAAKSEAPEETPGNVVSIMDALRRSLEKEKRKAR